MLCRSPDASCAGSSAVPWPDGARVRTKPNCGNRHMRPAAAQAIPFVYELRALLDWSCTATTLSLFDWFKLEDISASLFYVAVTRDGRERRALGERQPRYLKFLQARAAVMDRRLSRLHRALSMMGSAALHGWRLAWGVQCAGSSKWRQPWSEPHAACHMG